MTKDEALQMCLEYIETNAHERKYVRHAIKQALALDKMADNARELGLDYEPVLKDNSNYRLDPPVAEPVAWKWQQAPVKTSWGHEMVVADLAIGKDNTVSVYCERDQTAKVEAMFNPPAQPAPVQDSQYRAIEYTHAFIRGHDAGWESGLAHAAAQPVVPDALTSADIQEHIEYVAGWNECRQAMLEMMK